MSETAKANQSTAETPQPLWMPPRLERKKVHAFRSGANGRNQRKTKTAMTKTRRRKSSLRQATRARTLATAMSAELERAEGKCPETAAAKQAMLTEKLRRKRRL